MDGSRSSRASSSCGGIIAVDHDLPGSTNVGGYIGATDVLGMARHSLDSPTKSAAAKQGQQQHQHHQPPQRQDSYGLEFDGAVVMESVTTGARALMGSTQALMQHLGGSVVSLHSTTTQQQHHMQPQDGVKVVVDSGEDSDDDASDGGAMVRDDMQQLVSDSSQHSQPQQPQLAGKRATPEATRKAAAAAAAAEVGSMLSGPPSALGLDGPMPLELQSCTSASSISSRGSPRFYNRRGAGNGASRDLELSVRLNRARQTLDFAKRQAQTFAELDKAELGVWQALEMLDGLREYEAGLLHAAASSGSGGGSAQDDAQLTPDMSLKEHAFQVGQGVVGRVDSVMGLMRTDVNAVSWLWVCGSTRVCMPLVHVYIDQMTDKAATGWYNTNLHTCADPLYPLLRPLSCCRWRSSAGCLSQTSPGWRWWVCCTAWASCWHTLCGAASRSGPLLARASQWAASLPHRSAPASSSVLTLTGTTVTLLLGQPAQCCHCLSHSMGSTEYQLCLPLPDSGLAMHTSVNNHGRRKIICCADLGCGT
jgi:hypothetical protein